MRPHPIAGFAVPLLLVALLGGCAPFPPATANADTVSRARTPDTFAVVGDSITAGCARPPATQPDECSWVVTTEQTTGLEHVGGWVQYGATTTLMADSARSVDSDALVILAGTNNVLQGFPLRRAATDLESLAATYPADVVLLVAIPPTDRVEVRAETNDFNTFLETFALAHGWNFVDPWTAVRTTEGGWSPGMTTDGIHQIPELNSSLGETIGDQLTRLLGDEPVGLALAR